MFADAHCISLHEPFLKLDLCYFRLSIVIAVAIVIRVIAPLPLYRHTDGIITYLVPVHSNIVHPIRNLIIINNHCPLDTQLYIIAFLAIVLEFHILDLPAHQHSHIALNHRHVELELINILAVSEVEHVIIVLRFGN